MEPKVKQYKIHVAYINSNGTVVKEGIYDEGSFDLGEARYKSIVTLVNTELKQTETKPDTIPVNKFNDDDGIPTIQVESETKTVKTDFLKINSADVNSIAALKYVSKKNAEQVVALRQEKPFESYLDLNTRVPLKGKLWEDISALEFDTVIGHNTENSIYYSEGVTPL